MADGGGARIIIDVVAPNAERTSNAVKNNIKGIGAEVEKINKKRVADEQRSAREVEQINRQTARNAAQSEKTIEQATRARLREQSRAQRQAANDFLRSLKEMEAAERRMGSQKRSVSGDGLSAGAVLGGGFLGGVGLSAALALTAALKDGAKALIDYSSRMQQTEIAFGTLLGNSTKATAHIKELQKFATETPFEFESLAKISQKLQGVGVEAGKVIPLMRDVGNIAAATGDTSAERLEGIATALSQSVSKSKVSAEELNQLSERGVPALSYLAEATGKTKAEILKLSEQGAISSDVLIKSLQKISKEKFGDAMEKQSKTFAGAMSTIKDIAYQTGSELLKPFFDSIASFAVNFSTSLQSQEANAKDVGSKWAFALGETMGESFKSGWGKTARSFAVWFMTGGAAVGSSFRKGLDESFKGVDLNKTLKLDNDVLLRFNSVNNTFVQMPRYIRQGNLELDQLNNTIRAVEKSASSLVPIPDALKIKQAEENTSFLNEMIRDLTTQIAFFGQTSEVASVKQKLINKGIYDFDSALADSAISLAKQLDMLKEVEERAKKIGDLRKEIVDVREKAIFELKFPNATELDRFNDWVRRNASEFRELNKEILLTQSLLQQVLNLKGAQDLRDAIKFRGDFEQGLLSGFDTEIRAERFDKSSNKFIATLRDFSEKLIQTKNVTIAAVGKDDFGINIFPEDFSTKVNQWITDIAKLESQGLDASGFILQLTEYLRNLGSVADEKGVKTGSIFSDKGADDFIKKLLAMNEAIGKSNVTEALKNFNELMSDLNDKIRESSEVTEKDRVGKLLLGEQYKNLTEEQKKLLIAKAEEVDAFEKTKEATKKAQEEQKRFYEDTKDFLESVFDDAFSGRWKGVLDTMLNMVKEFAVKAAAQFAMIKIFGGQGGGFNLGSLFGGGIGSIFGGGTPGFNPNGGGSSFLSSLPIIGGMLGGGGGTGSLVGAGALASALGIGSGVGIGALGAGSAAAAHGVTMGAAAGGGGMFAGLGALMTNPWTIGIAAAAIGGFALWKLFGGQSAEKKLKKAAKAAFGVDIKDKNVLKQLKMIGESAFGKGQAGKRADEVVQLENAKDLIEGYAESTGQNTDKIGTKDYGSESYSGNQFGTSFTGFSSASSAVRGTFGSASESSITATAARSEQSGEVKALLTAVVAALAINSETNSKLESKIDGIAPGEIIRANPDAVADSYEKAVAGNSQRGENIDRARGLYI